MSKLSQNFDLLTQTSEKNKLKTEKITEKFELPSSNFQIMSHKFGFLLLTEAGWHWTVLGCWSYLSCGWQIWFCFLKRSILTHSFTSVYLEQWFHSKLSTLSITLWENPPTNRHTLTNKTKKQLKQMHNKIR